MMKKFAMNRFIVLLSLLLMAAMGCRQQKGTGPVELLVVTGGHGYDTAEFIQMFESLPDISFETALKPDAWKMLAAGREFDVIVFYDMWREISDDEKQVFLNEFEKGTGMVFLHHSLASHPQWPEYVQLIGGKYNLPDHTADTSLRSDYRHDILLQVRVIDRNHPVTAGMEDFEILDEGYSNTMQLPGVQNLLETSHPDCDRHIGWTHSVKNSKVVYLMGGHDKHAYEHPSFRELLSNAIHYTKP